MKLLARIIASIIVNGVALFAADYVIEGFSLDVADLRSAAIVAATLMILNFALKPVLKLMLGPVIVLTLGLGLIFVNGFVLWTLDIIFPQLTIQSIAALLEATLVIGAINFVFQLAQKD